MMRWPTARIIIHTHTRLRYLLIFDWLVYEYIIFFYYYCGINASLNICHIICIWTYNNYICMYIKFIYKSRDCASGVIVTGCVTADNNDCTHTYIYIPTHVWVCGVIYQTIYTQTFSYLQYAAGAKQYIAWHIGSPCESIYLKIYTSIYDSTIMA